MLIPHGNEKIYSLHLSWIVVLFITIILFMLVIFSYNAYSKYREISHKIKKLKNLYGKNYEYTYQIQISLLKSQTIFKKIFATNFKEFYKNQKIINHISYEKQYEIGEKNLKKEILTNKELPPGMDYIQPTYISKGIQTTLKVYNQFLSSLEKHITSHQTLYYQIPNGRPVKQNRFRDTSSYGIRLDPVLGNQLEFHTGIDMAGEPREPIFSTADGFVKKVFFDPGYGFTIIIQHPMHYSTLHAHLSQPLVLPNKWVRKGELIGLMGSTGRVTGTHLHYEVILPSGKKVDPFPFICLGDFSSPKCRISSVF